MASVHKSQQSLARPPAPFLKDSRCRAITSGVCERQRIAEAHACDLEQCHVQRRIRLSRFLFRNSNTCRARAIRLSPDRANGRGVAPGDIGFVGLGRMGTAMAKNLAAAGCRVIACVRRPQQMGTLMALGLKPTIDLADLFECEIVISMLPDDTAVREVAFGREDIGRKGLIAGLRAGAIHLSMSTISTAAASHLASEHARCGQGYVAAPVFGNPDAAKARQLFIVAAGAPVDVERCRPLLDRLGQRTFVVGNDPAHANLMKLMGNMLTATALEMLGETVALIRKRGLDPARFVELLTSTMFGGRVHRIYGERIVAQDYAAGFALPLVLKDVRLALAEAESAAVPMPSVSVVRDRLITGIARGYDGLDWTALGLISCRRQIQRSPHRGAVCSA
jgi:3-hydroxyisobutyrate dehydrogenase-like beta-hydroxyacid dehydrogenase